MVVQLDPAIKIDLLGNPGIRSFGTLEDVEDFVRADFKAWEKLPSAAGRIGGAYSTLIQGHWTALQQSLNEISAQKNQPREGSFNNSTLDSVFERYKRKSCVHSDSDLGRLALSLLHQDRPTEAIGIIFAVTEQGVSQSRLLFNTNLGQIPLLGILKGSALASLVEQGLAGRGKGGAEKLRELVTQSDTAIADTKIALNSFETLSQKNILSFQTAQSDFEAAAKGRLSAADQAFLTLQNAHAEKMASIEAAFQKEMELRAPRTYWQDKEVEHRISGNWWIGWLVGLAMVLIGAFIGAGLLLLGKNPPFTITSTSPATWLLIFGPVVVGLWLMRFINKQATMHLALRQDARERVTLVETYLALFSENKVREEQLSSVLQSVFRPSNVTGDDGMQATLVERLVEVLSKSSR